jgi:esterase/lipase
VLALRTEFYRQRLARMAETNPGEARRLMDLFRIDDLEPVLARQTLIVPVNITYYPLRAHDNALSKLAALLVKNISESAREEFMTEGAMLLSGVDIDIRFGAPIPIREYLACASIERDIVARKRIDFDDPISSRMKMRRLAVQIMWRYMTAIYGMTTVNHDHLFASMLKALPFARVDTGNLRRRVFLVTAENLRTKGVHFHRSLLSSQVSLLTDDRFNKYRDFITLALAKGIVKRKGELLYKDRAQLASPFDFSHARTDHPLAVIANEVVPLVQLQRKIRTVAWLTPFQLRRRIADYLTNKGAADFSADYAAFFHTGESKPSAVGAPRLIRGKTRELGILLIHGFLAAPAEMQELADYLCSKGVWVHIPRLKGHGTSPADLATRTARDWQDSVDEGYALLSNCCRRVVVGGFSLGGGLALDLAVRLPEVAGVFAVCPPMRLQDIASRPSPAVGIWNRLLELAHFDAGKKEFVEIVPEHPNINYARVPVTGFHELERFMAALESELAAVKAPALIVQAERDPVVNPAGTRRLFQLLGSPAKEYLSFDLDRHGILLGAGAAPVHTAIGTFCERIRRG